MTTVFAIALLLWVLGFLQTATNILFVPRLQAGRSRREACVSVIIPARNEERAIEQTVRAMLAQSYPNVEVIVVDDRSTDSTKEILLRLAAEDPRLSVLEGEEPPEGWIGKPWALHQGSLRARGELLLFVDADVHYRPEAVEAAVACLESSEAAMLTLFPRFQMHGFWEHLVMPQIAWLGFVVLPLWLANRTRSRHIAVGGGTGNLVWRTAYLRAGGHESLQQGVVDDVALAYQLRAAGELTLFVNADHLVSLRMYHGLREIVHGFTKNVFMVVHRSYVAAFAMLLFLVVVNLVPYAVTLYAAVRMTGQGAVLTAAETLAIGAVVVITATRCLLFSALGYRLDNAIFGHPLLTLYWVYQLVRSVWYTGIRNRVDWRGRTYDAGATRFGARR